jgi:hypothetical protein
MALKKDERKSKLMDIPHKKDTSIMENYVPTNNVLPIHNIIKSHLVIFHHSSEKLCSKSIESLTLQITETIDNYLNKTDKS